MTDAAAHVWLNRVWSCKPYVDRRRLTSHCAAYTAWRATSWSAFISLFWFFYFGYDHLPGVPRLQNIYWITIWSLCPPPHLPYKPTPGWAICCWRWPCTSAMNLSSSLVRSAIRKLISVRRMEESHLTIVFFLNMPLWPCANSLHTNPRFHFRSLIATS